MTDDDHDWVGDFADAFDYGFKKCFAIEPEFMLGKSHPSAASTAQDHRT
jgi:hypothetical protein